MRKELTVGVDAGQGVHGGDAACIRRYSVQQPCRQRMHLPWMEASAPRTLQHGQRDQQVGEAGEEEEGDVRRPAPARVHQLQHGVRLGCPVLQLQGHHCRKPEGDLSRPLHDRWCRSSSIPGDMITCKERDDDRAIGGIPVRARHAVEPAVGCALQPAKKQHQGVRPGGHMHASTESMHSW